MGNFVDRYELDGVWFVLPSRSIEFCQQKGEICVIRCWLRKSIRSLAIEVRYRTQYGGASRIQNMLKQR